MIPATTWEEKNIETKTWNDIIGLDYGMVDFREYKVSSGALVSFGFYLCNAIALCDMEGRVALGHFGPSNRKALKIEKMAEKLGGPEGLRGILATVDDEDMLRDACADYGITISEMFVGQRYSKDGYNTGYRKNVIVRPDLQQVIIHTNLGRIVKEF